MLKSLTIKEVYNSEDDNILEDFYIPALKNAVSYDRSVGYFDAKVLTTAARGLASFVDNGGYIRLIVGATLTDGEYQAISEGYGEREVMERLTQNFDASLNAYNTELFKNQLNTLTWFIQHKKMDVKIALRRGGIYHEKIGIIKDAAGDSLVFQGSANETNNALSPFNYESINVFKSWLPEFRGHIDPHVQKFECMWENNARNTKVIDFTEIASRLLARKVENVHRPDIARELELWQEQMNAEADIDDRPKGPQIPQKLYGNDFILKQHQKDALNSWKENGFNGLFELATGAGKTITAIYGAVKMYESRNKRLFLVVAVPYQSLADQWADNLRVFNINPLVCYGGEHRWLASLQRQVVDFQMELKNFVAVVVVDATLSSRSRTFSNLIESLGEENKEHFLFVGDECHHHGAFANFNSLPRNAALRIGLSATPDRDEEGNENLREYYGETVAHYTMKNALDDDVLTPYEYHLIEVSLTEEEAEQYVALSKRISQLIAQSKGAKESITNNNALNILLSKRARLINGTVNKPIALRALLKDMPPIKHSLFYCAEGNIDNIDAEDDAEGIKQIRVISELLHSMGWRSSQFTANEDKAQRTAILKSFKDGDIDSLVAMKCLDEGIDVPACSTAFILASSRQPRQFIQRRGRILRKSKGKTKAVIYDFFVTLPIDSVEDGGIERRLIIAELKRINEFASLSLNKGDAYRKLEPFLKKHDLTHHLT